VFSDAVEYVVLNPNWHVPKRIVKEEMLPRIVADPHYLDRNGIQLVSGEGSNARVVEPSELDLAAPSVLDAYRLRQAPGPHNPLGRIKFVMPNDFAVYLHDTPNDGCSRAAIARSATAASGSRSPWSSRTGCCRATQIGSTTSSWSRSARNMRHDVLLAEPVPVHLTYVTAFVERPGRLELRPDVYGVDEKIATSFTVLPARRRARWPACPRRARRTRNKEPSGDSFPFTARCRC
jgi:murein L,D-transpeptidase YcbB/YkuD